MLGNIVKVIIDRPINSIHPEHSDIIYQVNYGYIPNTLSAFDNEEIDAYVLGVNEPIKEFFGKVIAVIKRENNEEKLIVANESYSKEEIIKQTYFIEKYFTSHVIMNYTTKDDIIYDLKRNDIKSTDNLMIHSSLKSFGNIDGQDIVDAFIEFVDNGLVIFPTHSWATMKVTGQVFDVNNTPSCVGALTNIAMKTKGFKRSMHPTHSVCAHGPNKEKYLDLDLKSDTPVNPKGCFGALTNLKAKILFMGAPLTKITFVHSIEEEMDVEDRFTNEIFHFISIDKEKKVDYYMPKHFSTKNAHLSEHYEKLLPHMLKLGITKKCYIGNSLTYIVDAYKCHEYVLKLLEKNIHIFDNYDDYED